MLQVALAVGMFIGIVTLGVTLTSTVLHEYRNFNVDIQCAGQVEGARPLSLANGADIEAIDGVRSAEAYIVVQGEVRDREIYVFAFPADTASFVHERSVYRGRWYSQAEEDAREPVVVMARNIARKRGISVGDTVDMTLPSGTFEFQVIRK